VASGRDRCDRPLTRAGGACAALATSVRSHLSTSTHIVAREVASRGHMER